MGRYLKSIMKSMPVIQSRQLVDMLEDLRAKGQIRNQEEYQRALTDLSGLVNAENPEPSLKQIKALVWSLCSSDAHNVMMQSAVNDINAVFIQTDEIDQRLEDQHTLIMTSMMSELEHVINEQEDRIRRFQLIGSHNTEFTKIMLNSFASTDLKRMSRSEADSVNLFFNNRNGKSISEDQLPDAEVSPNGKKLLLGTLEEPRVLPTGISLLSDSDSHETDKDSSVNNNIYSVIDGTKGTFWDRTVYLDEPVDQVSTPLKFNLGTGRDINYAIIQGASQYPFYITEMLGITPSGSEIDLMLRRTNTSVDLSTNTAKENPLLEDIYVDGSVRVEFEQVFVKNIHIKFTYSSHSDGDFYVEPEQEAHAIYSKTQTSISGKTQTSIPGKTNTGIPGKSNTKNPKRVDLSKAKVDKLSIKDISAQVKDAVLSDKLIESLDIPSSDNQHINSAVYNFALDNVWFGNSLYNDSGVFVSEPLYVENPGVVSVQTSEKNVGESNDGLKNAGTIEYELIRKRIADGSHKIDHFPVPFLGQDTVIRERMLPIKLVGNGSRISDNAGPLRFTPSISSHTEANSILWATTDIKVYKNDKLIHLNASADGYQVAFRIKDDGDLDWTYNPGVDILDFSKWNISKQKLWILINAPSPSDVYTVSYKIRTSLRTNKDKELGLTTEQCVVYMNEDKTVRMEEDGKLVFIKDAISELTDQSELFLQISLRRNTSVKSLSPELTEFALLVAPYQ